MKNELKRQEELSTEEKIKEAARKVFMKRGFAATRTRDIAEEAGINLALLNYYFRSKKNLFEIIMLEKLGHFFMTVVPDIVDENTSLQEKVQIISEKYINLLNENPDLPLFVLNALQTETQQVSKIIRGANIIQNSALLRQFNERFPEVRFEHFFMNVLGLCIYPFVMRPALEMIFKPVSENFPELMEERKALIPIWIEAMYQKH